jgi:hypothetical protein
MTPRHSIARLADDAPVPHADSWPARQPPSVDLERRSSELESIWRTNMARRDAGAAEHGEPRTPHEFYRGRAAADRAELRLLIKRHARAYARQPRQLETIAAGLFNLSPRDLVTALRQINAIYLMRARGFLDPPLNFRGAYLYARYARAKQHQVAGMAL